MRQIDINCDVGESFGNWQLADDGGLLPLITSANVACGFHAGDPVTLLRTVARAAEHGVAIGAHPGYPDLLGFGRRHLALSAEDAYAYVVYQVGAVQAALRVAGAGALHHVKAHGAFSAALATDEEAAEAVVRAVADVTDAPMIYWDAMPQPDVYASAAERRGIPVVRELYPDLHYRPDGTIAVQRKLAAVDLRAMREQLRRFVEDGEVLATDGSRVPVEAQSICVHSDGPNALAVLHEIRDVLSDLSIEVAPPTLVSQPSDSTT